MQIRFSPTDRQSRGAQARSPCGTGQERKRAGILRKRPLVHQANTATDAMPALMRKRHPRKRANGRIGFRLRAERATALAPRRAVDEEKDRTAAAEPRDRAAGAIRSLLGTARRESPSGKNRRGNVRRERRRAAWMKMASEDHRPQWLSGHRRSCKSQPRAPPSAWRPQSWSQRHAQQRAILSAQASPSGSQYRRARQKIVACVGEKTWRGVYHRGHPQPNP